MNEADFKMQAVTGTPFGKTPLNMPAAHRMANSPVAEKINELTKDNTIKLLRDKLEETEQRLRNISTSLAELLALLHTKTFEYEALLVLVLNSDYELTDDLKNFIACRQEKLLEETDPLRGTISGGAKPVRT